MAHPSTQDERQFRRIYPDSKAWRDLERAIKAKCAWILDGRPYYVDEFVPRGDGAIDVYFCPHRSYHRTRG